MAGGVSQNMRRFNHLIGETSAVYHAVSLKLGLSDSVMQILYTVYESGDCCSLTDLCRLNGLSKQTVNSAIRRLERDGLVRLEPVNAKSKQARLTEQGLRFAEVTVGRLIDAENEIFDAWSEADTAQYLALTERYLVALAEKTKHI